MADRNTNDRIGSLEKEVKGLHNQLVRLNSEIGTIRQEHVTAISKEKGAEKEHPTTPTAIPVKGIPPNSTSAGKSREDGKPRWRQILDVVAILAGIVYAIVTCWQWLDLRHNFEADERSWIQVEYAWPDLISYEPNATVQAQAHMRNVGKTPTTKIQAHGVMELVDADQSASFNIAQFHSSLYTGPVFPTQDAVFPIELFNGNAPKPFLRDEFDDLHSGKRYLVVFGYVLYDDQFGTHWSRFCSWKAYSTARTDFHIRDCVPFNQVGNGLQNLTMQGLKIDQ